ncbi:bifunctional diaminohydroxyphosphoribosylaminopyrimidine deaminase/5-amino-6-(5-phosphoribosylamino)uracil reductase RibD [Natronospora cellulosivora (SeqCode)]
MTKDDKYYMEQTIEIAKKGEGYTSPNPLVGAIVVKDGVIVGKGYHQNYGGPHAEVYALDEAGEKAKGGTIYVSLEPCSHYGKTPPCSLKVVNSGVKRAVIAMKDPNPLVAGRGIKHLQDSGIKVELGLMEKEAKDLNKAFLKYISTDIPYVYLKTAQTMDGFLATKSGDSKWITNEKARMIGHRLRHKVDAILVGIGTVINDNPSLTTRLVNTKAKDSIRVILDTNLQISLDAKVLNQDSDAETIIVCGDNEENYEDESFKKKLSLLEDKEKVEVLKIPIDIEARISLHKLLRILHDKGISSLLVEGGGRVNYSFLQAGLVDEVYTFIAPKILGANDGISAFSGSGPLKMNEAKELKNIKYQQIDDNILLIGQFE